MPCELPGCRVRLRSCAECQELLDPCNFPECIGTSRGLVLFTAAVSSRWVGGSLAAFAARVDLGLGSTTAFGAPGGQPGARFARGKLPLLRREGRRQMPGAAGALWARAGVPRRPGRAVGGCSPCSICRHLDFVMWPMGLCRLVACLMAAFPLGKAARGHCCPSKLCLLFWPPPTASTHLGRTETCTELNPLRKASAQDGRRGEMAVVSRALRLAGCLPLRAGAAWAVRADLIGPWGRWGGRSRPGPGLLLVLT